MQPSDSVYKDGLRSPVLSGSREIRLGGRDMTRSLKSWELDRSYNTDLPEAMRMFSGSSSAQFRCMITGADQTITGLSPAFNYSAPAVYGPWAPRYASDIARPNQSVVFKYGYSGSNLDSFRGTIRERVSTSGTDEIELSALDGAERLRSAAIVPRPYTTAVWDQWVLSPALVVDNLVRDAGIHSCPPPRFDNLFYASGHDGIYPYRGEFFLANAPWTTVRSGAPFTAMAKPSNSVDTSVTWIPRKRVTENGLSSSFWIEFFTSNVDFDTVSTKKFEFSMYWKDVDPAQPDGTYTFQVTWSNTASASGIQFNLIAVDTGSGSSSGGSSFSNTQTGTYHFAMFINPNVGTGALDVQLRVTYPDKTYAFSGVFTMPAYTSKYNRYLNYVGLTARTIPFEALQMCKTANTQPPISYAGNTNAGGWVRGAYFPDACPFALQYLPSVSGSKWDTITTIAKATLATAEFDEFGQFRWREYTRYTGTPPTPSEAVSTISSQRSLSALTVRDQIDACRNFIQVSNVDFSDFSPSGVFTQFASVGNVLVSPGSSMSFVFPVDDAFEFDPINPPRLANTVQSSGNYVTAMNVASGGVDANIVKTDVEIEGFHNDNRQYQVTVYNQSSSNIWLYKSGGSGSGVLMEVPKDDTNFEPKVSVVTLENTTSQTWYGKQAYYHDAGPWVQGQSLGATGLAQALLSAGEYPIPILEGVQVIPDARLQLGDVVRVVDNVGNIFEQQAWIIGINTSSDDDGVVRQTLTLRGTAFPGVPEDAGLTPDQPVDPVKGSTA